MFWQGRCVCTLSVSSCSFILIAGLKIIFRQLLAMLMGHQFLAVNLRPEESTAVPSWLDINRQCKIIYATLLNAEEKHTKPLQKWVQYSFYNITT